ncbi:MAG TPA: thiamine pyrophosphate-dependent enzyme, partial [Solirubrobacteraceae bacterium]|nr:thiamine pyrophosphate-dependent enzyme [Solirubrobacteraceae bacterium]
AADIGRAATLIEGAERVAIVAGRGAVLAGARDVLEVLGERCGALLCTSAVAHGLFAGAEFDAGISGGFVTPALEQLLPQADVVLAFGATLNHWTTRGGRLLGDGAQVVQVDVDPRAIGAHVPGAMAVVGDAGAAAADLVAELDARGVQRRDGGFRTAEVRELLEREGRWSALGLDRGVVPGAGGGTGPSVAGVHPRALTQAVDAALPPERTVVVDSGHLTGWPAMDLTVRDARSWLFVNGFQAVGLGLGAAIGAAVARPGRITVAAVGDGGLFLALPELETAARLRLPLLVLVYDDAAYGAEVHHFTPQGRDVALAQFPDTDLAAIARGAGCDALTIRTLDDLHAPLAAWAAAPEEPLVVDAKVDPTICAAWLEDAFRGH